MNNTLDLLNYEIYPALFERADVAFPEHRFIRFVGGWRSNTYLDGTSHQRIDKTIISKKYPHIILEQGGEVLTLWDYIQKREKLTTNQDILKKLAALANINLPNNLETENYIKFKEKNHLFEDIHRYFVFCLHQQENSRSKEINQYLSKRGYSHEDIEAMELGYIPSQEKLGQYLTTHKKYESTLVEEVLKNLADQRISNTHFLTIPYRSGGYIKGFKFRTIAEEIIPKYLNSTGLPRNESFFNLKAIKGTKDLILVEGELDALHAEIRGIDNVVAIGGSNISLEALNEAKKRGAKSITLCLDTELDTTQKVLTILENLKEVSIKIYVATLPMLNEDKTDPDRLIKEKGIEIFQTVIQDAIPYYEYILNTILTKYGNKQAQNGDLTFKELDDFLEEVVKVATHIQTPLDRDHFCTRFLNLPVTQELGITQASLQSTIDKIRYENDKAKQQKLLSNLLKEAKELQEKGETSKALEVLEGKIKHIHIERGKDLIQPYSYKNWEDELIQTVPALHTGIASLDKFVRIPQGAITLIAGRPSHGKTTLMYNLLLSMSENYPKLKFFFFSYEEQRKYILTKILNRLIDVDLSPYYKFYEDIKPSNYEFLKAYIKDQRTDIAAIERGKDLLKYLLESNRIEIFDKNYTVEELTSLINYLKAQQQVGAIFIDYIQRMKTSKRTQDKRTEVAHISDTVLQIAKDTGLPIILGAQLNRESAGTPKLEHLKEAGNLEEDANLVLSVYNESRESVEPVLGRETTLEIKALKNRDGEVNISTSLVFDRYTLNIKDISLKSVTF